MGWSMFLPNVCASLIPILGDILFCVWANMPIAGDASYEDQIMWSICDNEVQNACSFEQASGAICDY